MLLPTLLLLLPSVVHGEGMPSPTVTTPSGRLMGRYMETRGGRLVQAYLGIPYAKPPVGPLRFEPPQPAEPWEFERLAVTEPLPCPQLIDVRSVEDCLYLNVFTPDTNPNSPYPVMFFIFPGAFEIGAAYGYTPEYLLDEDVLLVVPNFRVGLLGFLSTADEVVPGNMGLKDVRLALRWVRDNIRSFGGDPDQVTIQGQSSGASTVHLLMTFSAHEELFRAGISESGTALLTWAFHPPVEIRKMVDFLAELSGCPNDSVGFVDCLRKLPTLELLLLFELKYKSLVYDGVETITANALPLLGAVIEPECVEDRLVTGNPWDYNTTTPWLAGANSKEVLFIFIVPITDHSGALFLSSNLFFDHYLPLALNYQNSDANGTFVPLHFREFYLENAPINRLTLSPITDGLTDAFITYGTYEAVQRANKEQTYLYYFDYIGINQIFQVPPDGRIGASHTDELFFLFPHPPSQYPDRQDYLNPADNELSRTLVKMWTNFATCLDPNPYDTCSVTWEPFFPKESFLRITQTDLFTDQPFLPERMNFWRNQPFPYRNDRFEAPPCRADYTTSDVTHDTSCEEP